MSFAWFVARRYLTARRRQAFISLISAVSILGVGVGVMALIIALALMTGVQGELRDRIVGSTAHVYVYKPAGMRDVAAEVEAMMRGPASSARRRRVVGTGCCNRRVSEASRRATQGHRSGTRAGGDRHSGAIMRSGSLEALSEPVPTNARDGVDPRRRSGARVWRVRSATW